MKTLAKWIAMLGPAGLSPIAPATAGSALITLVGWFLPSPTWPVFAVLFALGLGIAIWSAGEAEKDMGHDAKPICVDEAIGQTIALLFVPRTPLAFFTAFVLFRGFDVLKPFGAKEAQRLPGGYGVVADDVIAGIVSCAAFHGLAWATRQLGWSFF